jgi:hypothetical protein
MRQAVTWEQAAEQFWANVIDLLTGPRYGHDPARARRGIDDYKREIQESWGEGTIPGVVYNQGEERVAEVIDMRIREGLPGRNGAKPRPKKARKPKRPRG